MKHGSHEALIASAFSSLALWLLPLGCQGENDVDGLGGAASGGRDGSGGRATSGGSGSGGRVSGGAGEGGQMPSGGHGGEGGAPPEPGTGGASETSVYGVLTQVFGTEGGDNFSYLIAAATPFAGELELDEGVEINGRAIAAGVPGAGRLYVGTDLSPTVTRYDLTDDGKFVASGSVSFLPAGVNGIGEYGGQFHFVSETKAYFFDGSTAQLIVWNPQEMTYTGKVSLAELIHPDELLTFGNVPLRQDGKVMVFPGWRSSDNLKIPSRAAVVTVDSSDDSVEVAELEGRCGYTRDGALGPDGRVYLATEAYGAAVYELNDANSAPPCLLRFDPDTGTFDESFSVDITTLFDGDVGGSLLVDGMGQPHLLRLDANLYMGPPAARPLASSVSWSLATLTLGEEPSVEEVDGPPLPGSLLVQSFGASALVPVFSGTASSEIRAFDDGFGAPVTQVTGLVFSVVKVR